MFRVFGECSGFFGGVPGFSGVPECSMMFRCSGVPCSGVPGSTTCRILRDKWRQQAKSTLLDENLTC